MTPSNVQYFSSTQSRAAAQPTCGGEIGVGDCEDPGDKKKLLLRHKNISFLSRICFIFRIVQILRGILHFDNELCQIKIKKEKNFVAFQRNENRFRENSHQFCPVPAPAGNP